MFANATVVAFVLLRSSRFNFHCYTQREPTPTQKAARKWQIRLFENSCAKDYEGHSLLQTSFAEPPNSLYIIYPGKTSLSCEWLCSKVINTCLYHLCYAAVAIACTLSTLGPTGFSCEWLCCSGYICSLFRSGYISVCISAHFRAVTISVQHASSLGPSGSSCEWL